MVTQTTSGNDPLAKKSLDLNGAGTSPDALILPADPILEGIGISLRVRHHLEDSILSAAAGLTSPATSAALALVQDSEDPLLYTQEFAAGSGPTTGFTGNKGYIRVIMADKFGGQEQTVVERQLYIAPLPDNAVQVQNVEGDLVSVNIDRFPSVVPLCKAICRVRFFPDWADEFSIRHFGGASLVSVFSRNDVQGEAGFSNDDVLRELEQVTEHTERIILTRVGLSGVELHQLTFRFRSRLSSSIFVDVDVDVRTDDCFLKTSRGPEFPDWTEGV